MKRVGLLLSRSKLKLSCRVGLKGRVPLWGPISTRKVMKIISLAVSVRIGSVQWIVDGRSPDKAFGVG